MSSLNFAMDLMKLYQQQQKDLYLVGGSVRDYLLLGDFDDFDFATPCLLNESTHLLNITKYDSFSAKFGTLKAKYRGRNIEITTFRTEHGYSDLRHPDSIHYVQTINEDYPRRDFTINALYMDYQGQIYDPSGGQDDLKANIIRCIGEPDQRIQEDPLRILRAIRFALRFQFAIEENLEKSILKYAHLVEQISEVRGRIELHKMLTHSSVVAIEKMFERYKINIHVADYIV